MGCISSKVLARTLSLHEERNKGPQRIESNSGISLLEDIIKSAQSSSDQYFELVLNSRSFGSNTPSKQTINDELTDSSETTVKLEISTTVEDGDNEEGNQKIATDDDDDDEIERSKSCHLILPPRHVLSSLVQENSSGVENKYELANEFWLSSAGFISKAERRSDEFNSQLDPKIIKEDKYDLNSSKGNVGSRSFHTVEEYDDLVRKLMLSKSFWFTDKDDTCSSGTIIDHIDEKQDVSIEKGNKRKAMAKKLGSLRIPSLSNIYAPGFYVTPTFGSYSSLMDAGGGKELSESSEDNSSIFPELVSEIEQSMQILEAEEEDILKQMESLEENDDGKIMDPQER